jgi:hypothetical protein
VRYKDLGEVRINSTEQQIKNTIRKLKNLGLEVNYYHHKKFVEAKRNISIDL